MLKDMEGGKMDMDGGKKIPNLGICCLKIHHCP